MKLVIVVSLLALSQMAWATKAFDFRRASDNVSVGSIDTTGAMSMSGAVTATSFSGSGSGLTGIAIPQASVEYTGTPTNPIALQYVQAGYLPASSASGPNLYPAGSSVAFSSLNIFDAGITSITFHNLYSAGVISVILDSSTYLGFPDLRYSGRLSVSGLAISSITLSNLLTVADYNTIGGGCFTIDGTGVTSIEAPLLNSLGGAFNPQNNALLTSISLPALTRVGGTFTPLSDAALTSISVPALTRVNGGFGLGILAALTTLSTPHLSYVGGQFNPTTMAALTTISAPELATVGGLMSFTSMASLATISLPALVSVGGNITANSGNGNIVNVTLGAAGTTLNLNSALSINFSTQKLNQASVDQILHTIASLDGTGGTTSWGTGHTLTLTGGTNSTPSAAGLTDKALITGRGATVTNN